MAQEREKRRIVIASVLKPVDDSRMFEKMGHSLAQTDQYEVTIIGFASIRPPSSTSIRLISLGQFDRLSFRRWWAKWRIFYQALGIKPDIFIFTSYELILPAIVLKVILNTRIIYDVRENYYRNILHSEGLTWVIRLPLALFVRLIEKLFAPAIDHFFLAEIGYEKEFKFHRGGWTVLENKAKSVASLPVGSGAEADRRPARPQQSVGGFPVSGDGLQLLFSGTLSESTGVFRAIHLARVLHAVNPQVSLTIAGYAATRQVRERLKQETSDTSFIRCEGIDSLVPHARILELINTSYAGVIAYGSVSHIENAVPTKLFEYLQASLPIITENHWHWIDRFVLHHPFVFCDFVQPSPEDLINQLTTGEFYTIPISDAGWESEEPKLLAFIKNIA